MDDHQDLAKNAELAVKARRLWAAVVLTAVDDAIRFNRAKIKRKKNWEEAAKIKRKKKEKVEPFKPERDTGEAQIERWANSPDGYFVLRNAGVEPGKRVTKGLVELVRRNVRLTYALARDGKHGNNQDV